MIAACGLDCRMCPLRAATFHAGGPLTVVELLRKLGVIKEGEGDDLHEGLVCPTCRGDRRLHWSEDCAIRKCCVDDRGLESCSECDGFPCERFDNWENKSPRHADALNRLRRWLGKAHAPREAGRPRDPGKETETERLA